MPTLSMSEGDAPKIDPRAFGMRHLASADWIFEYDQTQVPSESSRRKSVFLGSYIELQGASSDAIPARALEFDPACLEEFGRECASLARANAVGAGPQVLQIHACSPLDAHRHDKDEGKGEAAANRAVIIEEDVGASLANILAYDAPIPGPNPAPLHPLGTPERSRENAKILFDVFSELHSLHANGMFHRDLRAANVCVRSYGDRPEDLRATLIDFELMTDAANPRLKATAKEYFDVIFKGKTFLLPIEIDMGYLAAFCYELETGRPVREAGPELFTGDVCPLFRMVDGTVHVRRVSQDDLDALATKIGLIPVSEEGVSGLTGERLGLSDIVECVSSLINHGGYLDTKDILQLRRDPEFIILSNRERLALESFETYKEQVRQQGDTPRYENFYDQPDDMIATSLDNIAKYRAKAERFGYRIMRKGKLREHDVVLHSFDADELESLAKMEHDRWMEQKRSQGYVWGEVKDDELRTHPCLVAYKALPENEKDKDRRNIRNMIPFLEGVGLVICR